jgi:cytochrome P450
MGPAVWLTKHKMYALTRYDSLKQALTDDINFPSGFGVMMNEDMNRVLRGNTLCSDGEHHNRLRKVTAAPLTPGALKSLQDEIREESEGLVSRLVPKGSIEAITELAQYLPLKIVSNAVGLPEKGREKMLEWSEALFNCFGPMNERTQKAIPVLQSMMDYATNEAVIGKLRKGSWAEAIHGAAARGDVPKEAVPVLMIDYMGPSLDTTVSGIGSAVWHFANAPEEWDKVRENPSLIRNAVNEVLRLESPLQDFGRYVANDVQMGNMILPADSRVICFYGAGNRDPRQFKDPDRFDVNRPNANTHLAFGAGPHQCMGMNLARLEIATLFTALAAKVKRFHIKGEHRLHHNLIRGFERLDVEIEAA